MNLVKCGGAGISTNILSYSYDFRYHHMTVLIYAWYSYGDYIAPARWFVVMNYTVHSLMYTYYACKVKFPFFTPLYYKVCNCVKVNRI